MLQDDAVQEMIRALVEEDAAIDEAIQLLTAQKERVHAALAPLKVLLTPIEPKFDGGLAAACRQVLKQALKPMTPLEIRDGLKAIGYDLAKHENEMASIHSVLKRMAESKESKDVRKHDLKDGTRYSWTGETEPVRAPMKPSTRAFEVSPETMARWDETANQFAGSYKTALEQALKITPTAETLSRLAEGYRLAGLMPESLAEVIEKQMAGVRNISSLSDDLASVTATLGKIPSTLAPLPVLKGFRSVNKKSEGDDK